MAAVVRTQNSHGPCHDKRDVTPEEGRIHCKSQSEGCPVGSPDFVKDLARNRGHREFRWFSSRDMGESQVGLLVVSLLKEKICLCNLPLKPQKKRHSSDTDVWGFPGCW